MLSYAPPGNAVNDLFKALQLCQRNRSRCRQTSERHGFTQPSTGAPKPGGSGYESRSRRARPGCRARRFARSLRSVIVVHCALLAGSPGLTAADDAVDYLRDIRPILAVHCFACHGPDEAVREADLRLDRREAALATLPSEATAIVPGSPDESELVSRITSSYGGLVMPPTDFEKPLSPAEIDMLRNWIEAGAEYRQHWAFVAPQSSVNPSAVTDAPNSPIDQIVVARLEREGLSLSPTAPPSILCRRIHLDVVGLPPSPEEVEAFVEAAQRDLASAVEAELARLLASPHYGEKWARHWLDVARYSDSNGYEKDRRREQWVWRDWVIRAINSDQPYDQFLIEQIAGDLLPGATQDQIVATGFLRNSMVNEEGAIVPEEFRMEAMFDRMDCIGKAILGLTLRCAHCHSHKYDPISQDEYYGVMTFLNNADDAQTWVYTQDQLTKIKEVEQGLRKIRQRFKTDRPDWQTKMEQWITAQREHAPRWKILDTYEQTWVGGDNHPEKLPDNSICVMGHPTVVGEMYFRADRDLKGLTGLRLEALTYGDLPCRGPGRSILGTFTITELSVQVKTPDSDQWVHVPLQNATADYSSPDRLLSSMPAADLAEDDDRKLGSVTYLIDGDQGTAWHSDRGVGRRNTESVAVLQFAKPLDYPEGTHIQVSISQQHAPYPGLGGTMILGRFRLAVTSTPDPRAMPYDHAATLAMQLPPDSLSTDQQAILFDAWMKNLSNSESYLAEMDGFWGQYPDDPHTSVLSLSTRDADIRRITHVLERGVWNQPAYEAQPSVLSILHPLEPSHEPDRLRFARWLADARAPLTARVQVNRVWQAIFGMGLVETSEDFGTRAPQPEYLDLLDHLAAEFVSHGWSQKWLLREIVSSDVYQQTSDARPELLQRDPQNRLLARSPRFRAEAEVVRDIALKVSGLLEPDVGGPSFFPPVPESVINCNFEIPKYWVAAEAPTRYRRSIYLFRKRSMPDPVLTTFDAPGGETSCARRIRSNTSLAALTSLNEPVFYEAAQALALRVLREAGHSDSERAEYLVYLCTSRPAKPKERDELLSLVASQRERLAEGWLSIQQLTDGILPLQTDLPPETTPRDLAAWVIAARVVLNLDAALCKN